MVSLTLFLFEFEFLKRKILHANYCLFWFEFYHFYYVFYIFVSSNRLTLNNLNVYKL